MEFVLPSPFDNVAWYGRGPHESYPDRKVSAHVGRFGGLVADQTYPFILPGESGGKEDVRWVILSSTTGGPALAVIGAPAFHFDATHYKVSDIEGADHDYKLKPRPEVYVHVDGWHMGLGGKDGWTPNVPDKYLIHPGSYAFSFSLAPLAKADDDPVRRLWALGRSNQGLTVTPA